MELPTYDLGDGRVCRSGWEIAPWPAAHFDAERIASIGAIVDAVDLIHGSRVGESENSAAAHDSDDVEQASTDEIQHLLRPTELGDEIGDGRALTRGLPDRAAACQR